MFIILISYVATFDSLLLLLLLLLINLHGYGHGWNSALFVVAQDGGFSESHWLVYLVIKRIILGDNHLEIIVYLFVIRLYSNY